MCFACEQDAVWIAYLESRGLLRPDDAASVDALFDQFPVQSLPLQQPRAEPVENVPAKPPARAFSCDDPTTE
jgi:hypothetical protein